MPFPHCCWDCFVAGHNLRFHLGEALWVDDLEEQSGIPVPGYVRVVLQELPDLGPIVRSASSPHLNSLVLLNFEALLKSIDGVLIHENTL